MDPAMLESTLLVPGSSQVRLVPCLIGHIEQLVMEDLKDYESALHDPNCSSLTLGNAISQVKGAKFRELGTLQGLNKLLNF